MTGRRSEIQDGGSIARGGCRNRHKGTGQQSTGSKMAGRASGPPSCPVAVVLSSLGECRPASLVNYLPGGESGPASSVLKIKLWTRYKIYLIVMCRKYCLLRILQAY